MLCALALGVAANCEGRPNVRTAKRSLVVQFAKKPKKVIPAYRHCFPGIVYTVADFLKERGLAVHDRKRHLTT